MNVLEKVLEELENHAKLGSMRLESIRIEKVEEIIRSYMENQEKFEFDFTGVKEFVCQCGRHYVNTASDDWIPCSERLPEEQDSVFAIYKDTHLWSKSMFEKVSDPVNITYELEDGTRKTGTSHTLDGK